MRSVIRVPSLTRAAARRKLDRRAHPRSMRRGLVLAGLACVAASGGTAPMAQARPPEALGTYRLAGTARIAAGAALDRTVPVHADALLLPGAGPRDLLVRLGAEGASCDLMARLDDGGTLSFAPPQRCDVALRGPDARGHVDARLRSGRGRLRDDQLELETSWDLDGTVSFRSGGRVQVLGSELVLPSGWTPELPVQGRAQASASGRRDRSRAAD